MKFSELQLTEQSFIGIKDAGFENCMPVQERVFTHSLKGKDVMVQSQTGTGKTAAFLITIFEQYAKRPEGTDYKALIIVPTRELAVQIEQDANMLSKGLPDLVVGTFYGGVGYKKQDELLKKGVDIFIGTPGRLLDYEKARKIDYKKMDMIVVDEADRLFDMGFYPDIRDMFKKMRNREQRQTMLFSATMTVRARNLAWDFLNEPEEIEIEPETITVKEINQELFHVSKSEKSQLLLRILAKRAPKSAIVFTNTKSMAVEIAKRLELNGYEAHALMGDLPQNKRLQIVNQMKKGEIKFLVATDVAARGLHVDDLELVVNYDIPEDFENYVHRIGRTARAGKSGSAVTLACEQFVYGLENIEAYIQMKIPVVWADEETFPMVNDKSAHLSFRQLVKDYRGSGQRRTTSQQSRGQGRQGGSSTNRGPNRQGSRPPRPASSNPSEQRPRPDSRNRSEQRPRQGKAPNNVQSKGVGTGQAIRRPASHNLKGQSAQHKSLKQIEQMSFEDRLAYYKNAYGGDLQAEKASKQQKRPQQKSGKPASQNNSGKPQSGRPQNRSAKPQNGSQAQKNKTPQNKKPKEAVVQKSSPTAEKNIKKPKKGFIARIFGK